jgi:hypothetical protein
VKFVLTNPNISIQAYRISQELCPETLAGLNTVNDSVSDSYSWFTFPAREGGGREFGFSMKI